MDNLKEPVEWDLQFFKIHDALRSFFEIPFMYPDFPEIPRVVCGNNGYLRQDFSIYKKGAAYYVVDDGKWKYIETMENISSLPIVFYFNEFNLKSNHIWFDFSDRTRWLLDNNSLEIQNYEHLLNEVVSWDSFGDISSELRTKITELQWEMKPKNYMEDNISCTPMIYGIERISLMFYQWVYVVWCTDIYFTIEELEIIKERAL